MHLVELANLKSSTKIKKKSCSLSWRKQLQLGFPWMVVRQETLPMIMLKNMASEGSTRSQGVQENTSWSTSWSSTKTWVTSKKTYSVCTECRVQHQKLSMLTLKSCWKHTMTWVSHRATESRMWIEQASWPCPNLRRSLVKLESLQGHWFHLKEENCQLSSHWWMLLVMSYLLLLSTRASVCRKIGWEESLKAGLCMCQQMPTSTRRFLFKLERSSWSSCMAWDT